AATPNDAEARLDLSFSLAGLGTNQRGARDFEGALGSYRRSLALREAVSRADPANVWASSSLGRAWGRVGTVLWDLGRFPESCEAHRAGVSIFEALYKSNPASWEYRRDLALAEYYTGGALVSLASTAKMPRPFLLDAQTRLKRGLDLIEGLGTGVQLSEKKHIAEIRESLAS